MRWDSPLVLASAGTFAIHVIIAVVGDALVVLNPHHEAPPPPRVELVDVEVPPIVKPPPPPVKAPEPEQREAPRPAIVQHVPAPRAEPPPIAPPPISPSTPDPVPSGGAPVISEPDLAPSATGVAVASGARNVHIGRGGAGIGTGAGFGAGSAEVPATMSVATIKKRAMPRGDYSYEMSKDYPEEAKRLGIDGKIRVKLVVDDHGAVKSAQLLNRLGHGLDELAQKRANAIVFEPARDSDDRPVASVVVWTFDMTLPK